METPPGVRAPNHTFTRPSATPSYCSHIFIALGSVSGPSTRPLCIRFLNAGWSGLTSITTFPKHPRMPLSSTAFTKFPNPYLSAHKLSKNVVVPPSSISAIESRAPESASWGRMDPCITQIRSHIQVMRSQSSAVPRNRDWTQCIWVDIRPGIRMWFFRSWIFASGYLGMRTEEGPWARSQFIISFR